MKFSGTFTTVDNIQTYIVEIGTGTGPTIIDPTENSFDADPDTNTKIVLFAPDPITISCDRQDLMKRIIISQATINLLSNKDLTDDLFADTNRSIPVYIKLDHSPEPLHVFFGYVDPLQFSQGYAHHWESVTITATDPLGALEDLRVNQLPDVDKSTEITPYNLIVKILTKIGVTGSITGYNAIDATVRYTLEHTILHMNIFFGDSEDDYKTLYEILENICKYFNLYIAMDGVNSVILTSTINNTVASKSLSNYKVLATDDSTTISVDDIYSQVNLTCNIEPQPDLVVTFDDKDYVYTDYDDKELYMTEYISTGDGRAAYHGFYEIINGEQTHYDSAYTRDHYLQVYRNDMWDFGTGVNKNYIEYLGGSNSTQMTGDQRSLLTWLGASPGRSGSPTNQDTYLPNGICRAALIGFGAMNPVNMMGITNNNAPQQDPTLKKYLVISTNGKWRDTQAEIDAYSTVLQNSQPICKFKGIDSNVLSPGSANIVNFIMINCNILLNPLQRLTGSNWDNECDALRNDFNSCRNDFVHNYNNSDCWDHTVPYKEYDGGAYYNQFWYYGSNGRTSGPAGLYGNLGNDKNKDFQYNYSEKGGTDTLSKLPILCCQLKVTDTVIQHDEQQGDIEVEVVKYCVERLDGGPKINAWTDSTGQNKFEWLTQDQITEYNTAHPNNQIAPYFTIGIDPKREDYIIGQEYQIAPTDNLNLNLDKNGMAIPIKMQDRLNGTIEFSILGPYNTLFDEYGVTFFSIIFNQGGILRDRKSVISHIQSIMLSDLKIEMTSNNGGVSRDKTTADNDLVYASDEDNTYIEKLEEDIDICSSLTSNEFLDWGIKIQDSNSFLLKDNNTPFFGFESGVADQYIKPEDCYVDYLYKEYCLDPDQLPTFKIQKAARIMETQLSTSAFYNGLLGNKLNNEMLFSYFTGLPIGNSRIMSYDSSLKYKTIDLKFRQHRTITNQQIPTQSV